MAELDKPSQNTTTDASGAPRITRRRLLKGAAAAAVGTGLWKVGDYLGERRGRNSKDMAYVAGADVFPEAQFPQGGWFGERLHVEVVLLNKDRQPHVGYVDVPAIVRFTLMPADGSRPRSLNLPIAHVDTFREQEPLDPVQNVRQILLREQRAKTPPPANEFAQHIADEIAKGLRTGFRKAPADNVRQRVALAQAASRAFANTIRPLREEEEEGKRKVESFFDELYTPLIPNFTERLLEGIDEPGARR